MKLNGFVQRRPSQTDAQAMMRWRFGGRVISACGSVF